MPDFVQVRRDPFAREDAIRRVDDVHRTCTWCGGTRLRHGRMLGMFEYGTWTDGGRTFWHKGFFCSIGCHDSYHERTT